jgi:membrane protein implicated in regulation of membrane protease activity
MSYGLEWIPGPALLGALLFLMFVPGFALIAVVVLAIAAVAALVALAGAVLVSPYLLARFVRGRLAERRERAEDSGPVADLAVRSV